MKELGKGTSAVGTEFAGSRNAVGPVVTVACIPSVVVGSSNSIVVASKGASCEGRNNRVGCILGTLAIQLAVGNRNQVGTWGAIDKEVGKAYPRGAVQNSDFLLMASLGVSPLQNAMEIQSIWAFE